MKWKTLQKKQLYYNHNVICKFRETCMIIIIIGEDIRKQVSGNAIIIE